MEGYTPEHLTIHQCINDLINHEHNARYLWMSLYPQYEQKHFDHSDHLRIRKTVVKEEIVLQTINQLTMEHRERLLTMIERDMEQFKRSTFMTDKASALVVDDMFHDRFLTLKDFALRGKLWQIDLSPPARNPGSTFDEEEGRLYREFIYGEVANTAELQESPGATTQEDSPPHAVEYEKGRIASICGNILHSWKEVATPEEFQLLARHDGSDLSIALLFDEQHLKKYVSMESKYREETESGGLWALDTHIATTNSTAQAESFVEAFLTKIPPHDQEMLMEYILEKFRTEWHEEFRDIFSVVPLIGETRWWRKLTSPLISPVFSLWMRDAHQRIRKLQNRIAAPKTKKDAH